MEECRHGITGKLGYCPRLLEDPLRETGFFLDSDSGRGGDVLTSKYYIGQYWGRFLRASKNRFTHPSFPQQRWVALGCTGWDVPLSYPREKKTMAEVTGQEARACRKSHEEDS